MKPALSGIPETKTIIYPCWRNGEKHYYSLGSILGAFSMWAIRQSPYDCPDDLNEAVDTLARLLREWFEFDKWGNTYVKHEEIRTALETLLKKIHVVEMWNEPKVENVLRIHHNNPEWGPGYDFIDLDALARNTSHTLIEECLIHEG